MSPKNIKIWWMNPAILFTLLMLVIFLGTSSVSSHNYQIYYNVNKYINSQTIWYSVFASISFVLGIMITIKALNSLKQTEAFYNQIKRDGSYYLLIIYLLFCFTLFGYLMWSITLYINGASVSIFIDVLKGKQDAIYNIKHNFLTKVAGVTSFTNFGIPFMILAAYYNFHHRKRHIKLLMLIVICLGIFRAVFFAERLAILELFIPLTIVYVFMRVKIGKPLRFYKLIPVGGFVFVFLLFAIGEYFRSWANYYQFIFPSYFDFITTRFFGYYVTAINTGTLYVTELNTIPFPYFTIEWFWKLPLLSENIYYNIWSFSPQNTIENLLYTKGNPEFNNPSGLLLPYLDYGIIGGCVFWIILGVLTATLYQFFVKGYLLGVLLYPAWIIGITEIPRYLYFVSGRFFPAFVSIVLITLFITYIRKKGRFKSYEI